MKYKLLIGESLSNHHISCACGKCKPMITIDESMREEFKQLMRWDESEFQKRTIVINKESTEYKAWIRMLNSLKFMRESVLK